MERSRTGKKKHKTQEHAVTRISAFIEPGTESTDKIHFCGENKETKKKIKVTKWRSRKSSASLLKNKSKKNPLPLNITGTNSTDSNRLIQSIPGTQTCAPNFYTSVATRVLQKDTWWDILKWDILKIKFQDWFQPWSFHSVVSEYQLPWRRMTVDLLPPPCIAMASLCAQSWSWKEICLNYAPALPVCWTALCDQVMDA